MNLLPFNKSDKYDELYLTILKIGRKKVKDGLSYNQLKAILEKEYKYDFTNSCIELAVKHWFMHNFVHYPCNSSHPLADGNYCLSCLEQHLDCNFFLGGKACLALLEYENTQTTIKYSRYAVIVALLTFIIGIIIAIIK